MLPFDDALPTSLLALSNPAEERRIPIARGVRAAFDPHHLLNPGILGEDVA